MRVNITKIEPIYRASKNHTMYRVWYANIRFPDREASINVLGLDEMDAYKRFPTAIYEAYGLTVSFT